MAILRTRVSGAWVDTSEIGAVRYGGVTIPYGPPVDDFVSLFTTEVPAILDGDDATPLSLGAEVSFAVPGVVTHIGWYFPSILPTDPVKAAMFDLSGARISSNIIDAQFASPTVLSWNWVELTPHVVITEASTKKIAVRTSSRYVASNAVTSPASPWPLTNGVLSVALNGGRFTTFNGDPSVQDPTSQFNNGCYFVDVRFVPD